MKQYSGIDMDHSERFDTRAVAEYVVGERGRGDTVHLSSISASGNRPIEDVADLREDFERGFEAVKAARPVQ